jgi:hypothetical protein
MIIVCINGIVACQQKQITDYLEPSKHELHRIRRYKQVSCSRTITVAFRKAKASKRLIRKRIPKLFQHTLDRWVVKKRHIICGDPNADLHLQELNKSVKMAAIEPKSPKEVDKAKGPYLFKFPFMHLDRFYAVNSVIQEDFCNCPVLVEEWKYYQEVEAFTGLFQHMILLNSFSYWDTVEAEIRENGFHPKGFKVVEFIKWELLRHSTGITSYTDAQRIFTNYDKRLLASAFEKPNHIPAPYHASH